MPYDYAALSNPAGYIGRDPFLCWLDMNRRLVGLVLLCVGVALIVTSFALARETCPSYPPYNGTSPPPVNQCQAYYWSSLALSALASGIVVMLIGVGVAGSYYSRKAVEIQSGPRLNP